MLRLEDFEQVVGDIVKYSMNEKFENACNPTKQKCPAHMDDASTGRYSKKATWK